MGQRNFKIMVANQPLSASWTWNSVLASFSQQGTGPEIAADGTFEIDGLVYGPHYGPRGPRKVLISIWNQKPVGYCRETNNLSENLYAKWFSRGVNTNKPGAPDAPSGVGTGTALLAATQAAGLHLIAEPVWRQFHDPIADPDALDRRSLALFDDYWRVNWFAYTVLDEIDLLPYPLSTHVTFAESFPLEGVSKPVTVNFTRRSATPGTPDGSGTILWKEAFEQPLFRSLSQDTYGFHLLQTTANSATASATSPQYHISTYNFEGVDTISAKGRRFTASQCALATHLMANGPFHPGRSDTGELPVTYPAIAFNDPAYSVIGFLIPPVELSYEPGDKSIGHYCATGRVDLGNPYPQGGLYQPGRFFRDECWAGFVHGSSHLLLFPQCVGDIEVTGYVDAATDRLIVTVPNTRTAGHSPNIGGAMEIVTSGFTIVGFIDRDDPQVSGTPGAAGTYRLDPSVRASVDAGSSGTPVSLFLRAAAGPAGDDSDEQNLAELAAAVANLNRMQAHPTGGNLLIDPVNGGRRAFTVLRCPDSDGDTGLYKEDLTLAPLQPGYTSEGVAIEEPSGFPMWEYGWPMGFEGFYVTGDDGAVYIYVKSMSNGDAPTWFPGYSALSIPARAFGPFEWVGFRRVGAGAAEEMTGTSGVIKAGTDDGAATWFYIESSAITQNEGNSGSTAYSITVRRGGDLTGTDTVTATVSATGSNPANAADFGGSFPSEVLSFAPDEETKVFTVNVSGDTSAESDETFKVTLSSPSTGTAVLGSRKGELTCTITNDDAPLLGALICLGSALTGAPALPGMPLGAVHLNASETSNVTRGGITMRSTNSGPPVSDSGGFASTPFWQFANTTHGIRFELPAGDYEFAFIFTQTFGSNSGTVEITDDPDGAATVRQSIARSPSGGLLMDGAASPSGISYTNASTALDDCINGPLAYVPATVSDLGGGNGVVRFRLSSGLLNIFAVAVREVP